MVRSREFCYQRHPHTVQTCLSLKSYQIVAVLAIAVPCNGIALRHQEFVDAAPVFGVQVEKPALKWICTSGAIFDSNLTTSEIFQAVGGTARAWSPYLGNTRTHHYGDISWRPTKIAADLGRDLRLGRCLAIATCAVERTWLTLSGVARVSRNSGTTDYGPWP